MKLFQALSLAGALVAGSYSAAQDLRIYSDRDQKYFQKVFDAFQAKTGKTVELINGSYSELKTRFENGETGDVLLLKDVGSFVDAANKNYFQRLSDQNLNSGVPSFMQDPQGRWTAVSYRVRTIAFNPDVFSADDVVSYEALTQPTFANSLCIRNGNDYMVPFAAWALAAYGDQKGRELITGIKNNVKFFTGGDTDSLKAVESGNCSATITNHYYYARLKTADQRLLTELTMTNASSGGLHTNGFGGGVMTSATNSGLANEFIAFILSQEGSSLMISEPSFEYPAVLANKASDTTEGLGEKVLSEIPWVDVAAQLSAAKQLMEDIGWEFKK